MASETNDCVLRLRADSGGGENWLEVDASAATEVTFGTTNGAASLSAGQVGILATTLLNWLARSDALPEVTARLVRLAEFVSNQVGADPFEYPEMGDPEVSPLGLVSEFLHEESGD